MAITLRLIDGVRERAIQSLAEDVDQPLDVDQLDTLEIIHELGGYRCVICGWPIECSTIGDTAYFRHSNSFVQMQSIDPASSAYHAAVVEFDVEL